MASPEDITLTADDTKCAGCGHGFNVRTGRYGLRGVPGSFHAECLPKSPAVYRAGRLAALREVAKECDALEDETPSGSYDNGGTQDGWQMACRAMVKAIRSRIAALEEEAGR